MSYSTYPRNLFFLVFFTVLLAVLAGGAAGQVMDTGISYQGRLEDGGSFADGVFDFEFYLFTQKVGGSSIEFDAHPNVTVTDGLFTVRLDFGTAPFNGQPLWLETRLRPDGGSGFTTLPRQLLAASPYALYCDNSDKLDGLDANDFVSAYGDTVTGTLVVNGTVNASSISIPAGNVVFGNEYGLESQGGASIKTGPNGSTFQFRPGSVQPNASIAHFRDAADNNKVIIDYAGRVGIGDLSPGQDLSVAGNIEVGGICFRPRKLVRCWRGSVTDHMTWVDNEGECTGSGGVVEHTTWILAQC